MDSITIDDLVRGNLQSLISQKIAQDSVWSDRVQTSKNMIRSWDPKYTEWTEWGIVGPEAPDNRGRKFWSKATMSKRFGRTSEQLRGIIDTPKKGAKRTTGRTGLPISEVIHMACVLGVTPARLLQPTATQIKNNALITISNLGPNGALTVSAIDWQKWVNGLGELPDIGLDAIAMGTYGALSASTNVVAARNPWSDTKTVGEDISDSLSTVVQQMARPSPGISDHMKEDGVGVEPPSDALELTERQARAIPLLLNDLRVALTYLDMIDSPQDVKKQINWSQRRIGQHLIEFGMKVRQDNSD